MAFPPLSLQQIAHNSASPPASSPRRLHLLLILLAIPLTKVGVELKSTLHCKDEPGPHDFREVTVQVGLVWVQQDAATGAEVWIDELGGAAQCVCGGKDVGTAG